MVQGRGWGHSKKLADRYDNWFKIMNQLVRVGSLEECQEKVTHRQYLVMVQWLKDQWDKPSRSDWYLMQVAQKVLMLLTKKELPVGSQKLTFEFKAPPTQEELEQDEEAKVLAEKLQWALAIGYKGEL